MSLSVNKRTEGFTLVEMVVVMGIFMVLLLLTTSAFENVLKVSLGLTRTAQSQIEGVVGLDMLRKDLNAAGYGLPWSFQFTPDPDKYHEADFGANNPVKGLSGDSFNDAPDVPRAVAEGVVPVTQQTIYQTKDDGTGRMDANPGSDYLVVKSAAVAFNNAAGKWGYVNYSGSAASNHSYIQKFNSADDLVANEVVVTHMSTFSGSGQSQHVLAMKDAANFSYMLSAQNSAGNFLPPDPNYAPSGNILDSFGAKINNEKMILYGIRPATGSTDIIRMPFNRADYYVRRPAGTAMPARCNPGTGILYKTVIKNSLTSPGRTEYPLLDCVGDMQVIFGMQDPVDPNSTTTAETLAGLTAADIRARLKTIRVYLLVHEGSIDKNYNYTYANANNVIAVTGNDATSLGRTFSETDMAAFLAQTGKIIVGKYTRSLGNLIIYCIDLFCRELIK